MLIDEKSLQHWLNHFYGYGAWGAPIWFVSLDESGGELPEEVSDRVEYFMKAHGTVHQPTLCDIREMYRQVTFNPDGPRAEKFNSLYDYRFGPLAVLHGLWKNLIAFTHGYSGKKLPNLLGQQQAAFLSGQEALIRLYPLPAQNDHAWYYSWLELPGLLYLKSRWEYREHLFATRIQTILEEMGRYQPKVMLMYGMENINRLKDSVKEFHPTAQFTLNKAIPQKIPQYHRAEIAGTTLLITTQVPALHHRRVETGFDWEAFGKLTVNR